MNKQELVSHLSGLIFIMEHHERLGTTKNKFIVAEFTACNAELVRILEKEDEARSSAKQSNGVNEGRAEVGGDLSRRGQSDGEHGQYQHEAGAVERRPGIEGPDGK